MYCFKTESSGKTPLLDMRARSPTGQDMRARSPTPGLLCPSWLTARPRLPDLRPAEEVPIRWGGLLNLRMPSCLSPSSSPREQIPMWSLQKHLELPPSDSHYCVDVMSDILTKDRGDAIIPSSTNVSWQSAIKEAELPASKLKVPKPYELSRDRIMAEARTVTNVMQDLGRRLRLASATSQSHTPAEVVHIVRGDKGDVEKKYILEAPFLMQYQTQIDLLRINKWYDNCYIHMMKVGDEDDTDVHPNPKGDTCIEIGHLSKVPEETPQQLQAATCINGASNLAETRKHDEDPSELHGDTFIGRCEKVQSPFTCTNQESTEEKLSGGDAIDQRTNTPVHVLPELYETHTCMWPWDNDDNIIEPVKLPGSQIKIPVRHIPVMRHLSTEEDVLLMPVVADYDDYNQGQYDDNGIDQGHPDCDSDIELVDDEVEETYQPAQDGDKKKKKKKRGIIRKLTSPFRWVKKRL